MRVLRQAALIVVLTVLEAVVIGCRSRTGPTDEIAGAWIGTIADSAAGAGAMDMTLKRVGPALSGSWSATFTASGERRSGTINGTLVGSNVSMIFGYEPPMVCAGGERLESTMAFNGTLSAGGVSGAYVTLTCSSARTGTIEMKRQ